MTVDEHSDQYESKIEINDEVLHQTLLAIFVEIGEYLGLILGVSLLDLENPVTMITEFVNF